MAKIVVEGPDGAGKTTTVAAIKAATGFYVYPTHGPIRSKQEAFDRVNDFFTLDDHIFDRATLISEQVYGPILRNKHVFKESQLKLFNSPGIIVVYVRPDKATIIESCLETKPHKSEEHISKVYQKYNEIIRKYDEIMEKVNHIKFDRYKMTLEELCAELICRLENNV